MRRASAKDVELAPIRDLLERVGGDEVLEGLFFDPARGDQVYRLALSNLSEERGLFVSVDTAHCFNDVGAGIFEDLFLARDDEIIHADRDHGETPKLLCLNGARA